MSRLEAVENWSERAAAAGYNCAELARQCGVSSSQLRRYFAATFLQAPSDWLRELRLWHAAKLLCSGRTVKEVVWDLKFSDKSLLCHQFKAYHGCSPTEFIRLHRERQSRLFPNPRSSRTFEGELPVATAWQLAEFSLCSKPRSNLTHRPA